MLLSGRHVAYLILHPRLPIEPALIRYTTGLEDPVAIVILGNSITLTPGTITADVQGNELTIHAMDDCRRVRARRHGAEDRRRVRRVAA